MIDRRPPAQRDVTGLVMAAALAAAGCWIAPATSTEGGSIALMHLGGYETFEALPRIVDGLEAAGYDLVTLDEIVAP